MVLLGTELLAREPSGIAAEVIRWATYGLRETASSQILDHRSLKFIQSLLTLGDMVRIRMGPQTVVVVCAPDLTREVLRDDRTFDKGGPFFERAREVAGHGLATCPHHKHRRLRRLCQPAFHPDRLPTYTALFAESAARTSRSWQNSQVIDVAAEMTMMAARSTVETMFTGALPPQVLHQAVEDLTVFFNGIFREIVSPPFLRRIPAPGIRRYHRAKTLLRRTIATAATTRRDDHGDLLSALADATDTEGPSENRPLSEEELIDNVLTFFGSGIDTTAATLSWSLHLLATHPGEGFLGCDRRPRRPAPLQGRDAGVRGP